MLAFWIAATALLLLGLACFLPALLGRSASATADRARLNVLLHRQRQQELSRETASAAELEPLAAESERNLLGDLETAATAPPGSLATGRTALIATLAVVPFLVLSTYLALGRPDLLNPAASPREDASVAAAIENLAQRLKQNPNDLEGWVLLGRALLTMDQPREAIRAFEFAQKLAPDNLDIRGMYAESLAAAAGGHMAGKPAEIVAEILAKDPQHKTALWLAGLAAVERGDTAAAVGHWEKLRVQLPPDSPAANEISRYIDEASGRTGLPPAPGGNPEGSALRVKVTLAAELKGKVGPDDVVFIFARAAAGPPMPLAATRITARQLPGEVMLDDSLAVRQGRSLAAAGPVVIGARVSKSGQPTASPGDLEGLTQPLTPQAAQVYSVTIDHVIGSP